MIQILNQVDYVLSKKVNSFFTNSNQQNKKNKIIIETKYLF